MKRRVIVTPNAEQDLRRAYTYIRQSAPAAATQWMRRIRREIKTLSRSAERCSLALESDYFQQPVRELLFGKGSRGTYRILFVILETEIYILHVRHGSRDVLRS